MDGSQTLIKTVGTIRQPALVVGETVNASDAGRRHKDGMTAQKAGQRKIGAPHRALGATGGLSYGGPLRSCGQRWITHQRHRSRLRP